MTDHHVHTKSDQGFSILAVGSSVSVIFLQFCLYGSWDSLGPEFMHPKLKLCIQPGTRGVINILLRPRLFI